MPAAAILYGANEGPAHARRLRRALEDKGWQLIADPASADAIIAHSGGIYLLPAGMRARQLLIVAPACLRPGQLPGTLTRKIISDARQCFAQGEYRFLAYKLFWNSVYAVAGIRRNLRMLRGLRRYAGAMPPLPDSTITIIVNQDDPFRHYGVVAGGSVHAPEIRSGSHDDLWLHPANYISVLQ